MSSVVPGPNSATGKGGSVAMQAPNAPQSNKPSANFARGGSRLAQGSTTVGVGDGQSVSSETVKKTKKPKTMEDLDRRVEQDALELSNMKRDIVHQQKQEQENAQNVLLDIKKEYDVLKVNNLRKKKDLDDLKDKVLGFKGIDKIVHESSQQTQNICQNLTKQLASVEENCSAEVRTINMQQLILKRLQGDIAALRVESGEIGFNLEKTLYEFNSVDNTLQLSQTELGAAQQKLDIMTEQGKARAKERKKKMNMLMSVVEEGETSLSVIQHSIFEQSVRTSPISGKGSPDRQDFKYNLGPNGSPPKAMQENKTDSGKIGGGTVDGRAGSAKKEDLEDFDVSAASPSQQAKRMSVDQIEEMVERFRTRTFRMEKLEHLETDLKNNISRQMERKRELESKLEICNNKVSALASQRQVYQEVDHKAHALSSVRKECEEYKDKDYRLRVNLDSLKRSVPRLLAKLTKITHPVPSDLQLPDAINRLSIEISRCFKDISNNIIKDATAEDVASMHREDDETQSEIDKLHKLPGFSRLQKELFFNMMGARPDNSAANVRILSKMQRSGKGVTQGSSTKPAGVTAKFAPQPPNGVKPDASVAAHTHSGHAHSHGPAHLHAESPVIDRDTAKKISALVLQRDGKGVIPQPIKKVKKEVKKTFKFRG